MHRALVAVRVCMVPRSVVLTGVPMDKITNATPRDEPYKNTQDPKMQELVDRTAQAFCARLKLEDRLYLGEAREAWDETRDLYKQVKALHTEAVPYVLREQ